jgi:hypothetical protein
MANEVLVLQGAPTADGSTSYTILVRVPISTPIVVGSKNVVPTPAGEYNSGTGLYEGDALLPEVVRVHELVPQSVIDTFNAGTALWITDTIKQQLGETNNEVIARLEANYPGRVAVEVAKYLTEFSKLGTTITVS